MSTAQNGNSAFPDYINETLFEEALKPIYGDKVHIEDIKLDLITKKGDNYCSNIYRATVKFVAAASSDIQTKCLIIKDLHKEIIELGSVELFMYQRVLDKLQEIVNENLDKDEKKIQLAPSCLLTRKQDGCELYVFEDLTQLDFGLRNRWNGVRADDALLLFKRLAQFHASSMVFAKRYPDIMDKVPNNRFQYAGSEFFKQFIYGNIEAGAKFFEKFDDYKILAQKLRKNIVVFDEKMTAAIDKDHCNMKVIVHGDLWLTNILITPEKCKQPDLVFIDYQLACCCSPGLDINFFLHTSVPIEIIKEQRYSFIKYYYRHLTATLKRLNYPAAQMPSYDTLVKEVRRTEFYSLFAVMSELPLLVLSPSLAQEMSLEAFGDADLMQRLRTEMFKNERAQETIKFTLDRLNELGVLD